MRDRPLQSRGFRPFRVIYIATLADAVYVLHAFQKKTQATSKRNLDLATARFKDQTRRVRQ